MSTNFLLATFLIISTWSIASAADELTEDKKALIDELVAVVRVADDEDLRQKLDDYLTARILLPLKGTAHADDELLKRIVKQEVDTAIRSEIERGVAAANHRIYHHYLSSDELTAFLQFYRTPAGQKALKLLPEILAEARNARYQWGRSLQSTIERRVEHRFEREHPQATSEASQPSRTP